MPGRAGNVAMFPVPRKEVWFWALCAVATCLAILLASEVLLRFLLPQVVYSRLRESAGNFFAPSSFNPFTLKRNYRGSQHSQDFLARNVRITTNELGLRGREIQETELEGQTTRVLVLGDSYTFGVYVDDDETYCAVLEAQLRDLGKQALVLNAGYTSGFETDEQYCWLANTGLLLTPNVAVLGVFAGNDIMNLRPELWAKKDNRGLPILIKNPALSVDREGFLRSTVADYKTAGTAFVYKLPLIRESHLAIFIDKFRYDLRGLFSSRHLSDGGGYLLNNYPHLFKSYDERFDAKERVFLQIIKGMDELVREHGARLLLVLIPFNFEVDPELMEKVFGQDQLRRNGPWVVRDYYAKLGTKLQELKIPHINILREMRSQPMTKYYPKLGEVHLNARGHLFVATKIREFLLKNGWL